MKSKPRVPTSRLLFNPDVEEIPQAMSIRFNQMVYERKRAGQDVIVLSLGEAFFNIPLFDFGALDYQKGYHYSESQGILEMRKKIASYYSSHYGVDVNPETELLISAGSKPLIYMSMLCVLKPGEEVLVHEPCWLSYPEQARLCGAKPRFIPYDVPVRDFSRYMTAKTRMLILNNPNNPAGSVYPKKDIQALSKLCSERGIYLLVDEAYSDFVLDGSFVSAGRFKRGNRHLIIVNSLSKNMGISGWRIGYAIADPEVIQALLKVNQHVVTCAPTILMMYCAKYFDQILTHTLPQVREVVRRRARVALVLKKLKLKSLPGSSTFYFFVSLGDYPGTSLDFATELLNRHSISVVPGFAYGESLDRFIRVSVGSESEERIALALGKIKELITQTRAVGAVFTGEQDLDKRPSLPLQEKKGKQPARKKPRSRRTGRVPVSSR